MGSNAGAGRQHPTPARLKDVWGEGVKERAWCRLVYVFHKLIENHFSLVLTLYMEAQQERDVETGKSLTQTVTAK